MMQWVARRNIKRFEKLVEAETDPGKLTLLHSLLKEERAKLAALDPSSAMPTSRA